MRELFCDKWNWGVQGGLSRGCFKRRTALSDLLMHEKRTFGRMLSMKLLLCSWGSVFIFNAWHFFKRYDNKGWQETLWNAWTLKKTFDNANLISERPWKPFGWILSCQPSVCHTLGFKLIWCFRGILKQDHRTTCLMAPVLIEYLLKIECRNRRDIFLNIWLLRNCKCNKQGNFPLSEDLVEIMIYYGNHLMKIEKIEKHRLWSLIEVPK